METDSARSDADEVSVDEVNVVDNTLPNPSVTGLTEDEAEDLDSPEFFHRSRSAIRSGVKNVCESQTQDLVDSIKKEVGAFERRLTEDSSDNLPPRELDLSEQPLNYAFSNVTSTPTIQEFARIQDSIEQNIRHCNSQTEEKIEGMLDQVSECLQEELFREQQHLMLMQDKLDTSSQTLSRVEQDLTKRIEAEKNSRSLVQRTVRENKEFLIAKIHLQELEIEDLTRRMARLEQGVLGNCLNAITKCFGRSESSQTDVQELHYEPVEPEPRLMHEYPQ